MPTLFMTQTKIVLKSKYKHQQTENQPQKSQGETWLVLISSQQVSRCFSEWLLKNWLDENVKGQESGFSWKDLMNLNERMSSQRDVKHFRNYVARNHSNYVYTCLPFIKFQLLCLAPPRPTLLFIVYLSQVICLSSYMIFACTSHNMRWPLSLNICLPITEYLFYLHKTIYGPPHIILQTPISSWRASPITTWVKPKW